jgi:hypothetical protein
MKVNKESSFIYFVYPFAIEPTAVESRVKAIEKATCTVRSGEARRVWEPLNLPHEELIEHMGQYLNLTGDQPATARVWRLSHDAARQFGIDRSTKWRLLRPRGEIGFQFGRGDDLGFAVQLALFHTGVGFLTVQVWLDSEDQANWMNLLHYFRFARGQRGVSVRAERRTVERPPAESSNPQPAGENQDTQSASAQAASPKPPPEPRWVEFFPSAAEKHIPAGRKPFFLAVILALLHTASRQDGEPWWQEVFISGQLIPFATLYFETVPDFETVPEQMVAETVYRVRNFFHMGQEVGLTEEDESLTHPKLLPYAQRMWFTFSLEGCAFVAIQARETDFFRRELPDHLQRHYFLLFLIGLNQRFTLIRLSQEVSERWLQGDSRQRIETFERIHRLLMEFTARSYFSLVAQREHHQRFYSALQQTLMVDTLYQEVKDEVLEMYQALQREQSARIEHNQALQRQQSMRLEQRVSFLTAFIAVPTAIFSFLNINIRSITSDTEGLPIAVAVGIAVLSMILGGIVWWLLKR